MSTLKAVKTAAYEYNLKVIILDSGKKYKWKF